MSTQPNEGSQKYRQHRPAIDLCKVDRLKKLARETELLAMELVCEIYGSVNGSGHAEPPVPDDGGGSTNRLRNGNGHPAHPNPPVMSAREGAGGTSLHGSGHAEPPVPIVDALVSVAHGSREICEGCDKLS